MAGFPALANETAACVKFLTRNPFGPRSDRIRWFIDSHIGVISARIPAEKKVLASSLAVEIRSPLPLGFGLSEFHRHLRHPACSERNRRMRFAAGEEVFRRRRHKCV